jgi:hypothetical protein
VGEGGEHGDSSGGCREQSDHAPMHGLMLVRASGDVFESKQRMHHRDQLTGSCGRLASAIQEAQELDGGSGLVRERRPRRR